MREKEVVLQEYKGTVLETHSKTFTAKLVRGPCQFKTEIPFSEVPEKLKPHIISGATFLWRVMGYDTPNTMKLTRFALKLDGASVKKKRRKFEQEKRRHYAK